MAYIKIFKPVIKDGKVVNRESSGPTSSSVMESSLKRWEGLSEKELDSKIIAENRYVRRMSEDEVKEYLNIEDDINDEPKPKKKKKNIIDKLTGK